MSRPQHDYDDDPTARVIELRAGLLGGRGPGASQDEIAEHTRDRPVLGAVPPAVERALVARRASRLRAGEPVTSPDARRAASRSRRRAALAGAAAFVLARTAVRRVLRLCRVARG